MRVAALDLGTNTFLCLIAEGSAGKITRVLKDEPVVVRLGQEVDRTGQFHPDALARARQCLTQFSQWIDEHQVEHILGAATSAARDVSNGHLLFEMAEELRLPLQIIAGEEEARLSYLGACGEFSDSKTRLLVDIGGGSTELAIGRDGKLEFSKSLDMGGVRLTERWISAQPVVETERLALQKEIEMNFRAVLPELRKFQIDEIVAVAGTPTSLAALELNGFDPEKVDGYRFSRERLGHWQDEFARTSVEEKKRRFKLGGRSDIIFAGVSILNGLLAALNIDEVVVSTKGLRYGVAQELLSRR